MEPQLLGWLSPPVISSFVLLISVFSFYALLVKPRRNSNKVLDPTTSKIHHDRTVTSTVGSLNINGGDNVSDVIVVGAGVAGSALAYTLGKVTILFFFLSMFLIFESPKLGGDGIEGIDD